MDTSVLSQNVLTGACYCETAGTICTATVNISESAEKETIKWADIWAAAVAVDASKSLSPLIYLLPKGDATSHKLYLGLEWNADFDAASLH